MNGRGSRVEQRVGRRTLVGLGRLAVVVGFPAAVARCSAHAPRAVREQQDPCRLGLLSRRRGSFSPTVALLLADGLLPVRRRTE
jgi:hypothetical protein